MFVRCASREWCYNPLCNIDGVIVLPVVCADEQTRTTLWGMQVSIEVKEYAVVAAPGGGMNSMQGYIDHKQLRGFAPVRHVFSYKLFT